jgi:MerR family transcriptional regulator, redox-sensitive transcriptional activator SoxR
MRLCLRTSGNAYDVFEHRTSSALDVKEILMAVFGIGEIAKQAGVAPSAIRYYEEIGLLPPSRRVSGKRRYEDTVLQKLGVIRLAQQAGYTISEIRGLLHDFPVGTPPSERWQALAPQKIAELDARIEALIAMRALVEHTQQCSCPVLDDCGKIKTDEDEAYIHSESGLAE